MGRRRSRIRKVEEAAAELYDEITLPSGEAVRVGPMDRFDALIALLNDQGEQHWLATLLLEQDIDEMPEDAEDFLHVVFDMVVPAKKRGEHEPEDTDSRSRGPTHNHTAASPHQRTFR